MSGIKAQTLTPDAWGKRETEIKKIKSARAEYYRGVTVYHWRKDGFCAEYFHNGQAVCIYGELSRPEAQRRAHALLDAHFKPVAAEKPAFAQFYIDYTALSDQTDSDDIGKFSGVCSIYTQAAQLDLADPVPPLVLIGEIGFFNKQLMRTYIGEMRAIAYGFDFGWIRISAETMIAYTESRLSQIQRHTRADTGTAAPPDLL